MQKTLIPTPSKQQQVFFKEKDEKILVIKKNILFSYQIIDGLMPINFDHYQKLIRHYKKFMWRSKVELDSTYKQIIPYLIFTHAKKYFVMRRKNNASEVRLQNKYSLGIGGHIRKDDLKRTNIIEWAEREFNEEVRYVGKYSIEPIGILNDESNSVGQVHVGFVFILHATNNNIEIKNEHKEGMLLSLEECKTLYNQMENWSQIVIDYLLATNQSQK